MSVDSSDHCRIASIIISIAFAASLYTLAKAEFKPGNVFVSDPAYKRCMRGDQYGWDRIWEIDPYTGESRLFAELRDEECGYLTGLVFTPNGCRLRASQMLNSRILEFDSDGHWTTALDIEDGVVGPGGWGSNNLAYDSAGNFYVANSTGYPIMKFPVGGGPGEVFADRFDGVGGPGSLAVAATGDLYFGNWDYTGYILIITPGGVTTMFDPLEDFRFLPRGLSAKHKGHLFMMLSVGELYKYELGNADSRTLLTNLLAEHPVNARTGPIDFDPSETWLYAPVNPYNELLGLHIASGIKVVLANVWSASEAFGAGIAVMPIMRGDVDRDADVDSADFFSWARCVTGPHDGFVALDCSLLDLQGDSDVDLADFSVFQTAFGDHRDGCP